MITHHFHRLFFSSAQVPPDFKLIIALLFFGVLLNVMLFGVFIVQVYSYFGLCKRVSVSQTSSFNMKLMDNKVLAAVPLGPKLPEVVTALAVWLTSTAFVDLFITAFLVKFLWVNKTGFRTRKDSVTGKIILFTVQTGPLTSSAVVTDIVFFLIAPVRDFCH
ncbi:hypothetical protein DFH08DRAFT_800488 [Mycena albidolilacea]|uniref:DUF6534 domain-containing protein n=1 Tax=Mycena albidolilacea TaxID=1033008 RepID=A0AAD7AK47_9AGAR|nr:hypothetical protein DFH08DRAFT_800488 [Mycena albidolilacea]